MLNVPRAPGARKPLPGLHSPSMDPTSYHQRSKHHLERYARSLGYLDWSNQPAPFRSYEGAPRMPLPLDPEFPEPPFHALQEGASPPVPPDLPGLSRLLRDSLGLSAWKQAGHSRWALRVNPSSGNLHPTELYLLLGGLGGDLEAPGLFHYHPLHHALERRRHLEPQAWQELVATLGPGRMFLGLTSIPWREAWKYGERAFRYCQHDLGHALACLDLAAGALGWRLRLLPLRDVILGELLGVADLGEPEAEHPEALLLVEPREEPPAELSDDLEDLLTPLATGALLGDPLDLSREHHPWPVLDEVMAATRRETSLPPGPVVLPPGAPEGIPTSPGARRILHQRRSAQAFDGRSRLPREAFLQHLQATLPRPGRRPFGLLPGGPHIHLLCFVHRVDDLEPGLYLLPRVPGSGPGLREQLRGEFLFEPVTGVPEELADLVLLQRGDLRAVARRVCCHQDIASDSAYAVAMLGEFDRALAELGPWGYRHLHWEAGALGQVLYLEAEAGGHRGTGIGCFFDDAVHSLLGVRDTSLQSMYHFTVGTPLVDSRLQTLEAYHHLEEGDEP